MAISNNVTRINMRPEDNIDWRNEATENKDISKNDYIGFDVVEKRRERIGRTIKALRKTYKLTQKEISIKLGVAQQTYAGYENGKHEPSIETIIRLCDIFNVTMDYLTGRWDGIDEEKLIDTMLENQELINKTIEYFQWQKKQEKIFMKTIKQEIQEEIVGNNPSNV